MSNRRSPRGTLPTHEAKGAQHCAEPASPVKGARVLQRNDESLMAAVAKHLEGLGCCVTTWASLNGTRRPVHLWLVVLVPVDYQAFPVPVFLRLVPTGESLKTRQRMVLYRLRDTGAVATWVTSPEAAALVVSGVRQQLFLSPAEEQA